MRLNVEFERFGCGRSAMSSAPYLTDLKRDNHNLANLICVTNFERQGEMPQPQQKGPYTSQNRVRKGTHQFSQNSSNHNVGAYNHFQSSSIHAEDSNSYRLEKTGVSVKPPLSMALTPSVVTKLENHDEAIKSETNMTSHICLTSHPARSG